MNSEKFGIFVFDVLNNKELSDSQKELVILNSLDNLSIIRKQSIIHVLNRLDELDYTKFGELASYLFLERELLNSVIQSNLELQSLCRQKELL